MSRATELDATAVAALWTAAYTDDPRGGRKIPYAPGDFHHTAEAGDVLVAREEGNLAGVVAIFMAGAREGMVTSAGEAELSRLAVDARYKRRGIGRSLLESCLQLATESPARALVLWSRPHQVEAHRLYLSLDFRRTPDRDGEDADGLRLVFVRDL